MPIVPVGSLPLFAFSNDGTMAWLRASGPRLLAVDPNTGEVLREVRLDPAPFGFTWHVERHGDVFVVRDDREIAAYEPSTGARMWKRTWPTKVAILGEASAPGKRISVAPGPDGVDVVLADLRTGAFDPQLRVDGAMDHIGANGVLVGGMLFFATDQREAWAVDVNGYRVVERHSLFGSHVLPPVATPHGVHVAVVEARSSGHVTKVTTMDRVTGALRSSHELPGRAHALTAGASGLVLDVTRGPWGTSERVAFRPEAPHLRLVTSSRVEMNVLSAGPAPKVEILGPRPEARPGDEIIPRRPPSARPPARAPRDGLFGLLAMLDAKSEVLARIVTAIEDPGRREAFASLGVRFLDPRVRWSASPGRDPCLLDFARLGDGDALATYFYPPSKSGRVPIIAVSSATGAARWVADDVDTWLAGFLHERRGHAPDRVATALAHLDLGEGFPKPHVADPPPRWFFEAHGTVWTPADADAALAAGDVEGAERMLVSAARCGAHQAAKARLETLYEMLGWAHQRSVVVETW